MVIDPGAPPTRWLLLIHQLPPDPAYLRVKVGRRLARIGAVAVKNTVYVLPREDGPLEDLQWLRQEIVAAGGEATILDATLVEGLSDGQVEELFRSARDADYAALADEVRAFRARLGDGVAGQADIARFERRLEEIRVIDFFDAPSRDTARALVGQLGRGQAEQAPAADGADARPSGATWVTRAGVHVDRIGSAWLIRRFIDPEARVKLVPAKGYVPEAGELRFDMFEAEYGHEGEACTFETLCARFGLDHPGLGAVAEVVHDIDIKDSRFGRPETDGFAALVQGLCLAHRDDEARLARGAELFEALLAFYGRKRGGA